MSLKLSIILSRIGGITDIVKNDKTVFLVKNNNFKKYAKIYEYLFKKKIIELL